MSALEETIRAIVADEVRRALGGEVPAPSPPVSERPAAAPRDAEVLSVEELARFLQVDRKTVYEYAGRGVIPHRRLGKRILFSRSEVVSWLGACKAASTGKSK